jgi:hypothetical protein
LDNHHYKKPQQISCNNLAMALTFYGNMLLDSNEKRAAEANEYLQDSEKI